MPIGNLIPHPDLTPPPHGYLLVKRRDVDNSDAAKTPPFHRSFARRLIQPFVQSGLSVWCVNTTDRVISLTFDDGPDPEHTPRVLDVLAERGISATFFVIVPFAAEHPEILRRMLDEGHEIGLHGWDHRRLSHMTTRGARIFVEEGRRRLEELIERPVRYYRPPYGAHTYRQTRAIRGLGLELVIASCSCRDWLHGEEQELLDQLLFHAHPGAVHCQHDRRADPETAAPGDELPHFDKAAITRGFVDDLSERGYRFLPLAELLSSYPNVITYGFDRTR